MVYHAVFHSITRFGITIWSLYPPRLEIIKIQKRAAENSGNVLYPSSRIHIYTEFGNLSAVSKLNLRLAKYVSETSEADK